MSLLNRGDVNFADIGRVHSMVNKKGKLFCHHTVESGCLKSITKAKIINLKVSSSAQDFEKILTRIISKF